MKQLLIDGDPLIFRALVKNFKEITLNKLDGSSFVHYITDISTALNQFIIEVVKLEKRFDCSSLVFLSDLKNNWRNSILPSYKSNRRLSFNVNPAGREQLTEQVKMLFQAISKPYLEADDCIGIYATYYQQKKSTTEFIVVSIDKDFKSIPCTLYNPDSEETLEISEDEADDHFYAQAIAGDRVDGYYGCSGIGIKTALNYIQEGIAFSLDKDNNKWLKVKAANRWDTLLSTYTKNGYAPDLAIQQLQVARILRVNDYDLKFNRVIPFLPNCIRTTNTEATDIATFLS